MKVGLFIHAFYSDVLTDIVGTVPVGRFDGVVVTSSLPKEQIVSVCMRKFDNVDFIKVPNVGRDIAPFVIFAQPKLKDYDLCLWLHTKKSLLLQAVWDSAPGLGSGWCEYLVKNLAGTGEIVDSIIKKFEENPKLGMLFPEPYAGLPHKMSWGSNYSLSKELCRRMEMDLHSNPDGSPPPHSSGTMFWFRPESLRKLWNLKLKLDDFANVDINTLDGSIAHSLERIFGLIVDSSNYDVEVYTPHKVSK